MFPTVVLLENLLRDDGVILYPLMIIVLKRFVMKFLGKNLSVFCRLENNPKGRKTQRLCLSVPEYCVIYAKSKKDAHFIENIPKKRVILTLDENGNFVHGK